MEIGIGTGIGIGNHTERKQYLIWMLERAKCILRVSVSVSRYACASSGERGTGNGHRGYGRGGIVYAFSNMLILSLLYESATTGGSVGEGKDKKGKRCERM